jgi:hypothetical protein
MRSRLTLAPDSLCAINCLTSFLEFSSLVVKTYQHRPAEPRLVEPDSTALFVLVLDLPSDCSRPIDPDSQTYADISLHQLLQMSATTTHERGTHRKSTPQATDHGNQNSGSIGTAEKKQIRCTPALGPPR